jgi:hypothetical protein
MAGETLWQGWPAVESVRRRPAAQERCAARELAARPLSAPRRQRSLKIARWFNAATGFTF